MNCHGVGQQTMDNLNRQTRSTRPKPLFSVMRLSKSKLFWTAMGRQTNSSGDNWVASSQDVLENLLWQLSPSPDSVCVQCSFCQAFSGTPGDRSSRRKELRAISA